MTRILPLLITFHIFSLFSLGQECLVSKKYPLSTLSDFSGLAISNGGQVAISGDSGIIVYSSDTGKTWLEIQTPGNKNLTAIAFSDEQVIWATGINGTLVKSTNGPSNWSTISLPTTSKLNSIYFISHELGWICADSGKIFRTQNSGNSWIPYIVPGQIQWNSIFFSSSLKGWVVGQNGKSYKTTNGGQTWTSVSITTDHLLSVFFLTDQIGWIASKNSRLFYTFNGGQTWKQRFSTPSGYLFNSVCFSDSMNGFATGGSSLPISTTNGGKDWNNGTGVLPNFASAQSIGYLGMGQWLAVGKKGVIIKKTNTQPNWHLLTNNYFQNTVYELSFAGEGFGISTFQSLAGVTTIDSGKTWISRSTNFVYPQHSVHFQSAAKGWTCGFLKQAFKTLDSGRTWSFMTPIIGGTGMESFHHVRFWNEDEGLIVGDSGWIAKTTNGGNTWTRANSPTHKTLLQISIIEDSVAWIAGGGGVLLKTTDKGSNWEMVASGTTKNITALKFYNGQIGWFLAHNYPIGTGVVMKRTIDNGQTWEEQNLQNQNIVGFHFFDPNHGLFTTPTKILETLDSGNTYSTIVENPRFRLTKIQCPYPETCFISGDNGVILRWACDGVTRTKPTPSLNNWEVSPNPVSDKITIRNIESDFFWEIFSYQGMKVLAGSGNQKIDINILSSGPFLLRLSDGNRQKVFRMIKP